MFGSFLRIISFWNCQLVRYNQCYLFFPIDWGFEEESESLKTRSFWLSCNPKRTYLQHFAAFQSPIILASGDFPLWLPKNATIEALLPVALETCQKEGETQQEEPVMLLLSYWEIWLGVWLGSKSSGFVTKRMLAGLSHQNVWGEFWFWRFGQCCGISVTCGTLSPVFWRDNIWRTERKTLFDQEV